MPAMMKLSVYLCVFNSNQSLVTALVQPSVYLYCEHIKTSDVMSTLMVSITKLAAMLGASLCRPIPLCHRDQLWTQLVLTSQEGP